MNKLQEMFDVQTKSSEEKIKRLIKEMEIVDETLTQVRCEDTKFTYKCGIGQIPFVELCIKYMSNSMRIKLYHTDEEILYLINTKFVHEGPDYIEFYNFKNFITTLKDYIDSFLMGKRNG